MSFGIRKVVELKLTLTPVKKSMISWVPILLILFGEGKIPGKNPNVYRFTWHSNTNPPVQ